MALNVVKVSISQRSMIAVRSRLIALPSFFAEEA